MRREVHPSSAFSRSIKRLGKKDHRAFAAIPTTLVMLQNDAFGPKLGSHKIKGDLAGLLGVQRGL